jgi:tetratricopeptide (TPR) repeat protein
VFDKQTAAMGLRQPKWQFYPDARNRLVLQAALDQFQKGQKLKQISTRSSDGMVALFFYSPNVDKTVRTLRTLLGYDPVPELDNELMMEFNAMISRVNSREGTEVFDFRERGQQRDEDEASIALNKGDLKEALRLAELAMQEDPRDAGPHITRATIYVRQGNWQQALGDYTIAVQLDPVNIMWLFNRAVAHARLGQKADAIADFQKCLAMNPHPLLAERARDELAKLRK